MQLDLADGPECRKCGCCDSEVLRTSEAFGRKAERLRCSYCGHTWTSMGAGKLQPAPLPDVVSRETRGTVFKRRGTACPKCRGTDTPVTSTRRPVRHHKCRGCGECFKSVEEK